MDMNRQENIREMLIDELTLRKGGIKAATLDKIADALDDEGVEYGEIAIAACVIGFIAGRGKL